MKVTNWDTWQTFRKDRGTPPWIKVHRNLLSNPEWVSLTDSEKGQLVSMWILAADKGGSLPDNPRIIQRMAMLDDPPNINRFTHLGFMTTTCQPDDIQLVTSCREPDQPETETETETETEHWSKGFDRWWSVWPTGFKKGKKPAKAIWKRIKPDPELLIADTLNRIKNDARWIGGYIPNPTTYLNQERFNDDLTPNGNQAQNQAPKEPIQITDAMIMNLAKRYGEHGEYHVRNCIGSSKFTSEQEMIDHVKIMMVGTEF